MKKTEIRILTHGNEKMKSDRIMALRLIYKWTRRLADTAYVFS